MTIEFIKNLRDVKLEELLDVVFDSNYVSVKSLYVVAVMKRQFDFDSDTSRKVSGRDNSVLINCLMGVIIDQNDVFKMEVVLKFLEEFSEEILEMKYMEAIHFISEIIKNLTPALLKELRKSIKLCFTSVKKQWKNTPKTIITSIQSWLNMIPIKKITESIEQELFTNEHHLHIQAFITMSNIFDLSELILSDVRVPMSKWPKILLKLYTSGRLEQYFYEEMSYFIDMLIVSLKFLTLEDVMKILKSDLPKNGISFGAFFVEGFFEVLTEKPFILLEDEMNECSVILNDIVRMAVKKSFKKQYENVLELVDKLWPIYETHATFVQKHCLLANLQCLGPRPDSNPLQWATRVVCSQASLDERAKLLCLLPEEAFNLPEVKSSVASLFPARLRELRPALLEATAMRPDALLPTIAALAGNDMSTGWWDTALETCVAAAAKRNNLELCRTLFHKCQPERACERVLVPLLRHSSTDTCERFLASILDRILGNLKKRPKGDPTHPSYKKSWEEYLVSLCLLLVAFEKLPTSSLESPASVLYSATTNATPWHLVRETCKLCHHLRDNLHCPLPDDQLYTMYRKLQCLIYNVMCAAICRRRPPAPLYEQLLSTDALQKIVDDKEEYILPIRNSWMQRTKSIAVAVPLEPNMLSRSHTQRSRIFLRTLSEDPMLFDLHSSEEEQLEVQDISLLETPLNSHACAATLTALLHHAAGVSTLASLWRCLASLLAGTSGNNLKWLLAQVICNCKEELKPHASVLLPGLLAVLASVENGKCMNGLHLDVVDTILSWKEPITSDLNIITHLLITTCMENRRRTVFDGLLRTLQGWLELYGSVRVEWKTFETYYEDPHHDTQKALFKIIKTISKTTYIPTLLSKIVSKLDSDHVPECFGLAMACGVPAEKGPALGEFRKYLEKCSVITSYVRVLYYASLGCAECCGEQEFRKIADYVTKVTSADRSKCLHILSSYLSRGRRSEYIVDMFDTIDLPHMIDKDPKALLLVKQGLPLMDETMKRRCVSQIAALKPATAKGRKLVVEVMQKAYEDLFASPSQPPAKRQKSDSTPILTSNDTYTNSILTCLGVYSVDVDTEVAAAARDALGAHLDKELGARFAECFLLSVYLPAHTDNPPDLCVCVSALLEMLLGGVRGAEGFKETRLREEPLPVREEPDCRLLTLSRTFQGTFGSYSARGRTRTRGSPSTNRSDANNSAIDVQISIDSILQTLLDFAKTSTEAARSLLTDILRSVLSNTKFDVKSTLVPLLGTLLGREPTDLTPVYIDVCRVLEGKVGLLVPVERLRALTAGSEGAALTRLLYEEVAMRCIGDEMFQLGQPENNQDVVMNEITTFCIEDLKHAFGKLSNWDDLTLQQRNSVRNSLPPLWTERREFVTQLDSYQVPQTAGNWFDKMVASFKQQPVNSWRWLRKAEQWPRRHFEISAITEALSWQHDPSEMMPSQLFKTSDCLAECAARLLIRSTYYNSIQLSPTDDKTSQLSRSHELRWCMRANEMGIPNVALQCVERNVEDLNKFETLSWLRQKLLALRQTALERENSELLRDVLKKAEKYTPQFSNDPSVSIEMYHLMLLLRKDLKCLQQHDLQSILTAVDRSSSQVDWSTCSKEAVSSVFEIAMGHYDEVLETGLINTENAISNMSKVITRAAALNTPRIDLLLAVFLNRLNKLQGQLDSVKIIQDLLDKLAPVLPTLDAFSLELLEKNAYKLPSEVHRTLASMLPKDASVEKYRRCLQLVCDPNHLLVHYCEELVMGLRDKDVGRWKSTLDRMREKIFENPYAGPSYKLLDKYKDDLYGMYEFDSTSEFASRAEDKLKSIVMSVRREPQSTLRLSDLCPTLLKPLDEGVERWLGLRGVKVIKFYDKVQVFTDSIRRPVVLSMLLSCGRTHRVIQKTGERLASDAASQRVASVMSSGHSYSVTLLDEESALIEFLEGHERLRTMIATACNLEVLHTVSRPTDGLLIESPAACLQAHEQLCAKVPANALRSAMEQSSSCVQDFIWRKRNYTDSLADMTLLTWLLGLGDRHLQNIMCSRDGSVRAVDFGDVWRHSELPARLTRNLLAVADIPVLEARLQSSLGAMRGSVILLEATIRVAFHWMPDIDDQVRQVRGILRGEMSSYDISRHVTDRSQLKYKDKYLQILDRTLGDSHRELYTVEEQISCLLRHCTSPELLSVVRAGWEPWV
ncbi:uncharacterized protein LOC125239617 [Leguminivora glycinivorella]|uniref:uncharacterized protein LOC125239617 n=1 Tax=Leguminivora glycinivorella TaxID=1035111 RepID=UPI00200F261F|nr:uncharacterized protein LOC125239617 [Leguminivora glycinivorella]